MRIAMALGAWLLLFPSVSAPPTIVSGGYAVVPVVAPVDRVRLASPTATVYLTSRTERGGPP